MKCSRINLTDRKIYTPQSVPLEKRRPCLSRPSTISYTPTPRSQTCPRPVRLSISDIILPPDHSYKSETNWWANKRPRLKSHGNKPPRKPQDNSQDAIEREDSAQLNIEEVVHEYEIDENVQKLIEEATEYDARIEDIRFEDEKKSRKKKKKKKSRMDDLGDYDNEIKPRMRKTMNISRAASPQTEQVISIG